MSYGDPPEWCPPEWAKMPLRPLYEQTHSFTPHRDSKKEKIYVQGVTIDIAQKSFRVHGMANYIYLGTPASADKIVELVTCIIQAHEDYKKFGNGLRGKRPELIIVDDVIEQPNKETKVSRINREQFAELFRVDYKLVGVKFQDPEKDKDENSNKTYSYKVNNDVDVKPGDKVIVMAPGDALKIVWVVQVEDTPGLDGSSTFNYKWIVGPVNGLLAKYEENNARDKQLKIAVTKLERKLEQRSLKKEVEDMLRELPPEESEEFYQLFNIPKALTDGSEKKTG